MDTLGSIAKYLTAVINVADTENATKIGPAPVMMDGLAGIAPDKAAIRTALLGKVTVEMTENVTATGVWEDQVVLKLFVMLMIVMDTVHAPPKNNKMLRWADNVFVMQDFRDEIVPQKDVTRPVLWDKEDVWMEIDAIVIGAGEAMIALKLLAMLMIVMGMDLVQQKINKINFQADNVCANLGIQDGIVLQRSNRIIDALIHN
jgi:hypothetical protein